MKQIFLKKSGIFQVVGRLLGKCLKFRKIGFISKFTTNLAFSKLTEKLALSPNLQLVWLFLRIYSQLGSFSKCTIKCLLYACTWKWLWVHLGCLWQTRYCPWAVSSYLRTSLFTGDPFSNLHAWLPPVAPNIPLCYHISKKLERKK